MAENPIPEQLLGDCHHLGSLPTGQLLLHKNASIPWFIVVPDTLLQDILDLSDEHLHAVMADCTAVSSFIKQGLGYQKVNFAGLGNVVPDMHLHIVGRREGDPCWPQPVWGNLPSGSDYDYTTLQEWQGFLVRIAALEPVAL